MYNNCNNNIYYNAYKYIINIKHIMCVYYLYLRTTKCLQQFHRDVDSFDLFVSDLRYFYYKLYLHIYVPLHCLDGDFYLLGFLQDTDSIRFSPRTGR